MARTQKPVLLTNGHLERLRHPHMYQVKPRNYMFFLHLRMFIRKNWLKCTGATCVGIAKTFFTAASTRFQVFDKYANIQPVERTLRAEIEPNENSKFVVDAFSSQMDCFCEWEPATEMF